MSVASLPIIVCVSQAHGAAIEFSGLYASHHDSSQTHRTLFGAAENSLASEDCSDYRFDRGILVQQSRLKRSAALVGGTGYDGPTFAALTPSPHGLSRFVGSASPSWIKWPIERSSLSDLSTVVLLI